MREYDLCWFLLGLGIGSFINCLVYRMNNGLSWIKGRSLCPLCKHQLVWFDNIPLLSFVILRGKCRYCKRPISVQYPLVELATALLTIVVFTNYGLRITNYSNFFLTSYFLLLTYSLIAIFVSDLIYGTIPDQIVYPAIGISFLISLYSNILISNLAPALAAAGFFYFLVLITHGRGMGLGDVKLAGLMGLILGWPKILLALFLAFLTGAIVGVILVLLRKKGLRDAIPFGPFLALSTWITMLI